MTDDALLEHLLNITAKISSVEGKLDRLEPLHAKVEALEEAQNSLKWFASGAAAVVSVIFSTALAFVHGAK